MDREDKNYIDAGLLSKEESLNEDKNNYKVKVTRTVFRNKPVNKDYGTFDIQAKNKYLAGKKALYQALQKDFDFDYKEFNTNKYEQALDEFKLDFINDDFKESLNKNIENYDELIYKIAEKLKNNINSFEDELITLSQIEGIDIEEIKQREPMRIAKALIEEGIVDPRMFESLKVKVNKDNLEEDIEIKPGSTTIVQKYKEFDSKQEAENFIISEEGFGEMNIRYIPKTKKYRVVWEEIADNINEDIEKHDTPLKESKNKSKYFVAYKGIGNLSDAFFNLDKAIEYCKSTGGLYVIEDRPGYEEELLAWDPKRDTQTVTEDIEKHDTLNPKLFDESGKLKPEVREKVLEIVKEFTDGLKEDGIKINVKNIKLVGSNVSYNYTKDSDLDVHIVADTDSLECPENLYPLLYSAYRSLWNNKMDIDFYGIPVELYVETSDTEDLNTDVSMVEK